jgi:phosphatidate cytidylyltransferase
MRHLAQRLWVSFLLTSIILLTIYFSIYEPFKPIFTLVTAGIVSLALKEFYTISQENLQGKRKKAAPLVYVGIIGSVCYLFALFLAQGNALLAPLPYTVLIGMLFSSFAYFFFRGADPLLNLAITFFGIVYLTVPLGLMITLNFEFGRSYLIYLIAVTKLTDTGAYFIGSMCGKRQMAPYISPKKTWEGTAGGVVIAMISSLLMAIVNPKIAFSPLAALILGFVLSWFAIYGDLTESLLKRDMGVKDSSQLPGLGGLLDLVDSLVFTTPVLYVILKFGLV